MTGFPKGRRRLILGAAACLLALPAAAQDVMRMVVPLPPSLEEPQAKPEMICREPGTPSGSRVVGQKTCKTAREWNELHARGLDVGADGKTKPLAGTANPLACGSRC